MATEFVDYQHRRGFSYREIADMVGYDKWCRKETIRAVAKAWRTVRPKPRIVK